MAVHRISDRAEDALQRMSAKDGIKPSEWLSNLVLAYAAGLGFGSVDDNLANLRADAPKGGE